MQFHIDFSFISDRYEIIPKINNNKVLNYIFILTYDYAIEMNEST